MKLQVHTVRKARITGYQGKNRKLKGCIYLPSCMIGAKVHVQTVGYMRMLFRDMRELETKVRRARRAL